MLFRMGWDDRVWPLSRLQSACPGHHTGCFQRLFQPCIPQRTQNCAVLYYSFCILLECASISFRIFASVFITDPFL